MGQHQEELARLQLEDRKKKAAEDAAVKKESEGCTVWFFVIVPIFIIVVWLFK